MVAHLNMDYYCDISGGTNKIKSNFQQFQSQSHIGFEKSIQVVYIIEMPNSFELNEIFNEYITRHNENFDSYLGKNDFK